MARSGSPAQAAGDTDWSGWIGPLLVWGMYGIIAVAILITYSLVSPAELYEVSRSGFAGGASRALTYLNFPVAFAAISLLGIATAALIDERAPSAWRRPIIGGIALVALLLCLVAALPGVVKQSDLDARPINALPALGVALALALTFAAIWYGVRYPPVPWGWRGPLTIVVAGALLFLSLPWLLADFGVYVGDIPLIGRIFMSKTFYPTGSTEPAVHLGHHHGIDGAFFVIAALILGHTLTRLPTGWLRTAIAWYLGLMVAYGLANFANDFWLEQIVKRGWTAWEIPSMIRPDLSAPWVLVVLGIIVARYLLFRLGERDQPSTGVLSTSARQGS